MDTLITILGATAAFVLLFWILFTFLRNILPQKKVEADLIQKRLRPRARVKADEGIVMFTDIRNFEHERMMTVPADADYIYEEGYSAGWPDGWTDDLYLRRN